ncbi:MAG: hypothetical protein P4L86_32960 [Mycobacterium sp.]|nr:hypothetical protein [Mycobacterium sp.]
MASAFDVAGRLAEGEQALSALEGYVAACRVLGLAGAGVSVSQLYRAETGLDLAALAADVRALGSAAVAAEDVLRLQGNGNRELTAQWAGLGGGAAGEFLRRQAVTADGVVAQLKRSAEALATLRDDLWRAVDAKVDAVLRTDAQAAGYRDAWTAAARTVITGIGDVATASEIVDQQVKPFVAGVVGGELLPELRTASDAVVAAYDSAIAAATPAAVSFGVPEALLGMSGPVGVPSSMPDYRLAAAPTLAAAVGVAPWASTGPTAMPGAAPVASTEPVAPAAAPLGATTAAPEPPLGVSAANPAAMPGDIGLGSGVSGLGQQLADAIGGVLGSVAGLTPGGSGLGGSGLAGLDDIRNGLADDPGLGDKDADLTSERDGVVDDSTESDESDKPDESGELTDDAEETPVAGADGEATPADSESPAADPSAPTPPTQPTPDPPAAVSVTEPVAVQETPTNKTPCQIAAEELPQVGE